MTDEKINKLATQFVDELFAYDDMSDQENIEAKNDALVICMAFAIHILENHCIVEKSEILADYEFNAGCFAQFSASGDNRNSKIAQWHKGKCDELESLFGSELFNGTEK